MEAQHNGQTIAIIITQVKNSSDQLYPLTKNYPMGLLQIGSKKLIVYQLQQLLHFQISKIIMITSNQNQLLQQYIKAQFLNKHKQYPHPISFFSLPDYKNSFVAIRKVLQNLKTIYQRYILVHGDTIIGASLKEMQKLHEKSKSDLTLMLKAKRQNNENQKQKKIPEGQLQTQIDLALLGQNNEVLFIDMAQQYQRIDSTRKQKTKPIQIDPSIYMASTKSSFKRVLDSKFYIFNHRIAKIIMNLNNDQIYSFKPEFLQLVVQNQTNRKFINFAATRPSQISRLRIYCYYNEQQSYIRKISSKKIYQSLNFDSLIKGAKQRDLLQPTIYSDQLSDRKQFQGQALISENVILGQGLKIRRCIISKGCKIGKNVQILNSILLNNVVIKDNCKIIECILGANTIVGQSSNLKQCQSQNGSRISDGHNSTGTTFLTIIQ